MDNQINVITHITKKGQITIPKIIREFLHVKDNDDVKFIIKNNRVALENANNSIWCEFDKQERENGTLDLVKILESSEVSNG